MARTRERVCESYICEHQCKKGKDAVFYGLCQTCPKYNAKKGAKPARKDRRKEKKYKIEKKEMKNYI